LDGLLTSTDGTIITLPKGLSQFEVRVPTEEKDVFAYYYLLKHAGRSLLFVNSIKTARRVDGLLRALGINCRTIHAQLQQRQRLRALESFRSSPIGVLVATDVAARGLDIPKIQSVIHYDIARSPQVYIHRAGRTARAGSTGVSVSLPSPEDSSHHKGICDYLSMPNSAMPLLSMDLSILPMLRDRVKLAKKIFTQSFVASQSSKDNHWLQQNADQADLEIDEYLVHEVGDKASQKAAETTSKKALEKAKYELRQLLETPLEDTGSVKRKGHGFFVYAK
jgi:ATP-dependent RNA helicase DDX24/MAK5